MSNSTVRDLSLFSYIEIIGTALFNSFFPPMFIFYLECKTLLEYESLIDKIILKGSINIFLKCLLKTSV